MQRSKGSGQWPAFLPSPRARLFLTPRGSAMCTGAMLAPGEAGSSAPGRPQGAREKEGPGGGGGGRMGPEWEQDMVL